MSYQVLARKWRPKTFAELIGQNHVKSTLINALNTGRLHHAYLFTGTRGVGKTTIARIFAKSLNCQTGVSAEPCGTCNVCTSIEQGQFVDLIEIDAASRTKVEDTREILDNVMYAPTQGRYKVYLIDEVHMLSRHSFNALLKTLEEPPEHVKFLLATTEAQKLPITILSRCLQFNLTAIARNEICDHIAHILTAEQIEYEPQALPLLAKAAEGSLRDGLSLTDQAIAQAHGLLKADDVRQMLGSIDKKWTLQLLAHIVNQDAEKALGTIDDIAKFTPNYRQLVDELLSLFHLAAMVQLVPNVAKVDENVQAYVMRLAQKLPAAQIQVYYQILLSGKKDMQFAPDARMGFEMLMLRLLAFRPLPNAERPAQDDPMPAIADMPAIPDPALKKNTEIQLETESKPVLQLKPEPEPEQNIAALAKEQNALMFAAEQQGFKSPVATEPVADLKKESEPALKSESTQASQPEFAPAPIDDMPLDISFSADDDDQDGGYGDGYGGEYSYEQLPTEIEVSSDLYAGDGANSSASASTPEQQTAPKSALSALGASNQSLDNSFTPTFDDATQDPVLAILANRNIPVADILTDNEQKTPAPTPAPTPTPTPAPLASTVEKTIETVETDNDKLAESKVEVEDVKVVEEPAPSAKQKPPAEQKPPTGQDEQTEQTELTDKAETPVEQKTTPRQITDYQPEASIQQPQPQPSSVPELEPEQEPAHSIQANSDRPRWAKEVDEWANLIEQMGIGGLLRIFAVKAVFSKQDKQVTLTVDATEQHLDSQSLRDQLEKSLTLTLNEVIELHIEYTSEQLNTPFNIQRKIEADRLAYAQAQIHSDNIVNALQQRFDAIVDEQSIQALG